jgi:hypothetical protein
MAALTLRPGEPSASGDLALARQSARETEDHTVGVSGRLPCSILRSRLTEIDAA